MTVNSPFGFWFGQGGTYSLASGDGAVGLAESGDSSTGVMRSLPGEEGRRLCWGWVEGSMVTVF